MTTYTDDELTEALERLASRATTPEDGRRRVEQRLRARRTRRRATLGATAMVSVIALGALAVELRDPADQPATVSATDSDSAPSTTSEAPQPVPAPEEPALPKLALAMPGMHLTLADVDRTEFTAAQLAEPLSFRHFQSFRSAPDDWSLPSVYVYTIDSGAHFGIGEDSPSETTTTVDVNGNVGYLLVSGAHRSLGWRLPDGTAAYVLAPAMEPDELLNIGRSMTLRPDGHGWDVTHLPPGLRPIIDEPNSRLDGVESHSLTFEGDAGTVELHSYTTTLVDMETRIADYSIDAEVSHTTVHGHPAVITRSAHDVRVLWYDPADSTANYMIIDDPARTDLHEILAGVTELTDEEWQELLDTVDAPGG